MPKSISDHWTHLRTVHFALLLASLVLGIASFDTLGSSRAQKRRSSYVREPDLDSGPKEVMLGVLSRRQLPSALR